MKVTAEPTDEELMAAYQKGDFEAFRRLYLRYEKRIITTNKNAAIEPPLKFAVMEAPNGKAMVKYFKPTYTFGKYDGLDELGAEFETLMETILNSILK